jgi:hypothetical protein
MITAPASANLRQKQKEWLAERASVRETQRSRLRVAHWTFQACLAYTILATGVWLVFMLFGLDGGSILGSCRVGFGQVVRCAISFTLFWMVWSYGFHWLKYALLRRAGFSKEELRSLFGSRLHGFNLERVLEQHSERTIRIIDMIGRRGRNLLLMIVGFALVYSRIRDNPHPEDLAVGLNASFFDALVMSWWTLLTFHNDGVPGHMAYGAQARILDGVQGRANALCIMTLWNGFKFVMIPLGMCLAIFYSPKDYVVLFSFIWLSYGIADFASEIIGSLWGRHDIHVWGLGDIKRKSWQGVIAAFVCTLIANMAIVYFGNLSLPWAMLGIVLAFVNPLVELFSPRGTDDFTMATTNALICLAFGWLVFAG